MLSHNWFSKNENQFEIIVQKLIGWKIFGKLQLSMHATFHPLPLLSPHSWKGNNAAYTATSTSKITHQNWIVPHKNLSLSYTHSEILIIMFFLVQPRCAFKTWKDGLVWRESWYCDNWNLFLRITLLSLEVFFHVTVAANCFNYQMSIYESTSFFSQISNCFLYAQIFHHNEVVKVVKKFLDCLQAAPCHFFFKLQLQTNLCRSLDTIFDFLYK